MIIKTSFPTFVTDQFEAKLTTLNKKLEKIGRDERAKVIKTETYGTLNAGLPIAMSLVHIDVPIDNNMKLVGYVNHKDDTRTYYSDSNYNLTHIKNDRCDHCNTKRKRNLSYVFLDNNKEFVVGSSCMDLYLGANIEKLLRTVHKFEEDMQNNKDTQSYINSFDGRHIDDMIKAIAYINEHNPNIHYTESTTALVWRYTYSLAKASVDITPEKTIQIKEKLFNMFRDLEPTNNFEQNVYNTLFYPNGQERDYIASKCLKFLTYATLKALYVEPVTVDPQPSQDDFNPRDSNFIGTAGYAIKFKGIVRSAKKIETRYGETILVHIVDENKNLVKFFSTAKFVRDLETGEFVHIEAIVKKHDGFKGLKTTLVKCPKLIEKKEPAVS